MPTLNELAAAVHPPGTLAASTSLFDGATATTVARVAPLAEIMADIRGGKWAADVGAVRDAIASGNKERAEWLKRRLPAFTVSAVLRTRAKDAGDRVITHTGWLQADFDGKENPGMVQRETRAALIEDVHCGAVFVGPSGSGIKALVRIDPERHAASVEAARVYFRDQHGLTMDRACRDIERLCFVSHDPDAWTGDRAAVLPVPESTLAAVASENVHREDREEREAPEPMAVADVREVLQWVPSRPDYDTWIRVVSGVASVLPMAEAIACLQEWSPPEKPGEYEVKWSHRLQHVTIRSVIRMAQAHGFDAGAAARRRRWMGRMTIGGREFGHGKSNADLLEPDKEPDESEDLKCAWDSIEQQQFGDAKIFERKCRHLWKYDELAKRWRRYNAESGLWVRDMVGESTLEMRRACMQSYEALNETIAEKKATVAKMADEKGRRAEMKACDADLKETAKRVQLLNQSRWCSGVMDFATRLPAVRCRATDFDQHRHLLAVRNGVLDFRANTFTEFNPHHMLTAAAPVDYMPDAVCPHFDAFLLARMGGDLDLVYYLWRLIGYCLTGFVDHDALFLCYGTGSNGKSTLFKVLECLMGPSLSLSMDIAVLLGGSAETSSAVDYHKASLEGKRLVLTSETPEEKPLNEAMVKQLLGGESIQARRLYEMPYTFAPTHKIWMATNHKPNIKGTDHGIWRRIHLIPWEHKIPVEEQRPREEIVGLFCSEMSGILNRALAGYGDYLARGAKLDPPAAVLEATDEYRQDEDGLGNYLADNLQVSPTGMVKVSVLLDHYLDYCKSSKERAVATTARKLITKLKERKMVVEPYGNGGIRHLMGFRLIGAAEPTISRSDELNF